MSFIDDEASELADAIARHPAGRRRELISHDEDAPRMVSSGTAQLIRLITHDEYMEYLAAQEGMDAGRHRAAE